MNALLERAVRAADADRYTEARDFARRALELTKTVRVSPRILAALHETEGLALWMLEDVDAQEAYEASFTLWEEIPGAERDIARISRRLAMTYAFPVMELERAEQLLRRSIELTQEVDPTNTYGLLNAHHVLLDVLHQECRTADALPLIEAAESIDQRNAPADRDVPAMHRIRANFAANTGDIQAAINWEKRVVEELRRTPSSDHVLDRIDVSLYNLARLERDRGNYEAARAFVEQRVELWEKRGKGHVTEGDLAEELHWAYLASRDPRLAEHDAKNELVSAQLGEPLFPANPPQRGACRPEVKPYRGWLHRYQAVSERAETCLKDRSSRTAQHSITINLRVVSGKVVSAEAVGRRADSAVVRCTAETALGYEHPTDKYSEFAWETLE